LGSVLGLGVDAPLWWSSGPSGGRKADQWLRRTYGLSGGEVQAANSLRGAALVQGVLFVARMREHRPGVRATEAHPKALLKALRLETWDSIAETLSVLAPEPTTEHERDAVVAAIAARKGFEGRWTHDLSRDRNPSEQDPDAYWLAPVRHYWPEE
jgi:predicted nuclease with RNAse H fold